MFFVPDIKMSCRLKEVKWHHIEEVEEQVANGEFEEGGFGCEP